MSEKSSTSITMGQWALSFVVFISCVWSVRAVHYVMADDCDWKALDVPDTSTPKMTFKCRFQAIRGGPDGTNFSLIQPDHVLGLSVFCDALFAESKVNNGTFGPLRYLRDLHIEQCKLSSVPSGAFSGLSDLRNLTIRTYNGEWGALSFALNTNVLSDLKRLERLDLGHNNMISVPKSVFCPATSLKLLNLTRNAFSDLTNMGFSDDYDSDGRVKCLKELVELDLSFNNLRYIDDRAFSSLTNLRKLFLQDNHLSQLVETAFIGLNRLQLVNMANNQLNTIPPKLLHGSTDLRELYLQNNSIGLLSPQTFRGLEQLVILNLSYNQISSEWITHDTFAQLIRLVILHLSNNQLRHINSTTFETQSSLQILYLDNNQIETVDDHAFSALHNLHTLILSNNRLRHLDSYTLNGLYVLSNLALDGNLISSIDLDAFKNCSSLQDLELSGNKLTEVPKSLQYLRFLRALDLSDNIISDISKKPTLSNMTSLHSLSLSGNQIENMTKGTFQNMRSLRRLDLSNNRINSLEHSIFDDALSLNMIQLNDNALTDINGLFMNLRHLRLLNVSRNAITWFDLALVPLELKHLDIHSNEIEALGNYFELEGVMHLKIMDVSHNKIKEINGASFPNKIESIMINHNRISIIHPFTFMAKANLTKVNLTHNRLQNVDINAFRMKALPEKKILPEFWIGDNPYFCDCSMEWMQRINDLDESRQYPRIVDLDKVECQMPFARRKPSVLLVEANSSDFLCKYKSHCFALCHCCEFDACDCEMVCPENCTCYSDQTWNTNIVDCSFTSYSAVPPRIPMDATELYLDGNDMPHLHNHSFIGRKNLKKLYLNNSNVQYIHNRTFTGVNTLHVLHLDHNKITHLRGYEFVNLTNLRELYLEHNRLTHISNATFVNLRMLRVLHLDNNYIVEFQIWNFNYNPQLTDLRLANNHWSCECQFMEQFQDWIQMFGGSLRDVAQTKCRTNDTMGPLVLDFNSTSCSNRTRVTVNYFDRVFADNSVPIVIGAMAAIFIILLIIIVIFIYRKEIKVLVYSKYGVRLFERSQSTNEPEKLFDAFLSYCKKDEAFVAQILAPELECGTSPPYRLCLRYRDLPISGYVAEAVTEAIEYSHRSIIVLSEQFLRSEWCRFELKSAAREAQCGRGHHVVVVVLDRNAMRDLDPDARTCLRHVPTIYWGEKRFWEKLRYALPDTHLRTGRKQQVVISHHSPPEVTVCPPQMINRCPSANGNVKLV